MLNISQYIRKYNKIGNHLIRKANSIPFFLEKTGSLLTVRADRTGEKTKEKKI